MSETGAAEAPADADTIEAGEEESMAQEAQNYESPDENYEMQEAQDNWDSTEAKEASLEILTSGESSKVGYHRSSHSRYSGNTKAKELSNIVQEKGEGSEDNKQHCLSIENTIEDIVESHPDSGLVRLLKELAYITKGFLDFRGDENPYEKIDRIAEHGTLIAVMAPGLGSFPQNGIEFEKYSGIPTIRLERKNPKETDGIVSYVIEKTRVAPVVIGYSDGYLDMLEYVKKYGPDKISTFYGVDSNKGDIEKIMDPSRVIYINSNTQIIEPFEKIFYGHSKAPTQCPVYKLPKTTVHSSIVVGPDADLIGKIIEDTARAKYLGNIKINLN